MRTLKVVLGGMVLAMLLGASADPVEPPMLPNQDVARIHEHYVSLRKSGQVKSVRALPARVAGQVDRDRRLPGGVEYEPLPGDLERDLSPLPEGLVRVRVGYDVAVLDSDTLVVRELARNVVE